MGGTAGDDVGAVLDGEEVAAPGLVGALVDDVFNELREGGGDGLVAQGGIETGCATTA